MKKNILWRVLCLLAWLPFVSCEDEKESGFDKEFYEKQQGVSVDGLVDNYTYVDLGLSVDWATYNVGASKPIDSGYLLSWGETSEKDKYTYESYKFLDASGDFTKYCPLTHSNTQHFFDGKIELEAEDDAAKVNWGGGWRMPSQSDWHELMEGCDWTWVEDFNKSGVSGWLGVSKKNGKTIFLPAFLARSDEDEIYEGQFDFIGYWSSSLLYGNGTAFAFHSDGETFEVSQWPSRYIGLCVRPVVDNVCVVNFYAATPSDTTFLGTQKVEKGESLRDMYLSEIQGYHFVKWSASFSNVQSDMNIYAIYEPNPKVKIDISVNGNLGGHDYVDLGLPSGLKWATYNVGAANVEEPGEYFAWGEITPKNDYAWGNYKWSENGSEYRFIKYSGPEESLDSIFLEPEDDAAMVKWGSGWRMPTWHEYRELIAGCDWTRVDDFNGSGLNGMKGVSKTNGNSIFIPCAGQKGGDGSYYSNDNGYYWSSSIFRLGEYLGFSLRVQDASLSIQDTPRCFGLCIRAVCVVE